MSITATDMQAVYDAARAEVDAIDRATGLADLPGWRPLDRWRRPRPDPSMPSRR